MAFDYFYIILNVFVVLLAVVALFFFLCEIYDYCDVLSKKHLKSLLKKRIVKYPLFLLVVVLFFLALDFFGFSIVRPYLVVKKYVSMPIFPSSNAVDNEARHINKQAPDKVETASLGLPRKPQVGYKKFLVLNHKRIGFGAGGATLGNKYYPNGTVFDVIKDDGQYVTINLEGKPSTYYKKDFSGNYGTAGSVATYKWDFANNRPTAFDLDDEIFRQYFHFVILAIYQYFWQFTVAVVFLALAAYFVFKNHGARNFIIFSFICFLLIGGCQGQDYRKYLIKFDSVTKLQGSNLGGFAIGPGRVSQLDAEPSFGYSAGNVFYVPLFIASHVSFGYFLFFALPALFYLIHYFFVPHPVEKYIKAVKKGKIKESEAFSKITDAMYDIEKESLPFKWKSDNWRKRIEALTRRVKSEDRFMNEVINYVKTKSRFN